MSFPPAIAIKLQEQGMKARASAEEAARKALMNPQPIDASKQPMSIARILARRAGVDKSQQGGKKPAAKRPASKKPAAKKPAAKKKPATKKK